MAEPGETLSPDDPARREATAALLMRLRSAGVRDLAVLRAIEATPRHLFATRSFRDLAFRDLRLPLPCGQSMPDAASAARLAEAMECSPRHRLLEIGAGSGYCTAVFARLAGEILAIERYRSLVVEAQARLDALGLAHVALRWGDGLDFVERGPFDRILVHALVDAPTQARLLAALAPGGALVVGEGVAKTGCALVRYDSPVRSGEPPRRREIGPARLRPLDAGVARAL